MQLTRGQGHFLQWGTCKQSQQQSYSLCWKGNWGLHSISPQLIVLRQIPEEFRHSPGAREGFLSSFRAAATLFSLLPPAPAHLHLPSGEGKDKPLASRALLQISSCCLTWVRLHPCYLSSEHSIRCNGIAGAVPKHCGMLASVNKTLSKGNIWAQRSIHTWYIPASPEMQFSIAAAKEG